MSEQQQQYVFIVLKGVSHYFDRSVLADANVKGIFTNLADAYQYAEDKIVPDCHDIVIEIKGQGWWKLPKGEPPSKKTKEEEEEEKDKEEGEGDEDDDGVTFREPQPGDSDFDEVEHEYWHHDPLTCHYWEYCEVQKKHAVEPLDLDKIKIDHGLKIVLLGWTNETINRDMISIVCWDLNKKKKEKKKEK